ncbi:hypothetical protein NDN08_004439 [Rhodosorus marinus]|uniref:Na+/H+ antiporter NhaC-like C-terminal domain-containing protein n=1 Tax=Rhodosorus marinus TaxID=101924 RepID=A0AAV8UPD1_9RHOD|nr:hypothetical protein NDN08_004439 [Rhodosorus marinus]
MKSGYLVLFSLAVGLAVTSPPAIVFDNLRPVYVDNVEFSLTVSLEYSNETTYDASSTLYSRVLWNNEIIGNHAVALYDEYGLLRSTIYIKELLVTGLDAQDVTVENSLSSDFSTVESATASLWFIPGAVTLLSPILVIIVAVWTREVLYALYIGIFTAAFIVSHYDPFQAFLRVLDTYLVESLGDVDHAFVILFTWFLSGLIACISRSGGSFGIAEIFKKFAKTRMTVQLVIFFIGFVIFFDSYANTLILGNTMRFVSDAMWVSREKLSFLVDATTSPVASIAPISSWIGFEVGLIQDQIDLLLEQGEDLEGVSTNGYMVFLATIPSRFYPIIMLFFQFFMIIAKREFGPMLVAERRSMDEHKLVRDDAKVDGKKEDEAMMPDESTPLKWWNGVVPIVLVIFIVLLAVMLTGRTTSLALGLPLTPENIFGHADANAALLYGSFTTTVVAWFMYRFQYVVQDRLVHPFMYWLRFKACPGRPLLTMQQNLDAFMDGIRGIFQPILVLILAWAIGAAIADSGADIFFSSALTGNLDPRALPVLTFLIAAVISFCTGTSWGTMSILFPLIVPTSWYASHDAEIFTLTISAILAGSVFGDHCTPISDTTILSAISSRCDLMHHTITQLPYALVVAVISILFGYLPCGYSAYESFAGLGICALASVVLVIFLGVRVDHPKRRLDVLTLAGRKMSNCCGKTDEDVEVPKTINLWEYDAQTDEEFVDILRPNFWKLSTWKGCFTCNGKTTLEEDPEKGKEETVDAEAQEAVSEQLSA